MQAVEALTRIISMADNNRYTNSADDSQEKQDEVALAICQAMLNTAIPVARFRCHVSIEAVVGKTKLGVAEYTISSVDIPGIKAGMAGLMMEGVTVSAHLFEQKATHADMLSGYQGQTKTLQFRNWLAQIDQYETTPTVQ